jgi:hypothetical protein
MAYVFGRLNDLIGQNDQGRQQGQQGVEKRVGTESASASPASPQDFSKSTFQNAGAILDRNKNVNTQAIGSRIEQPAQQRISQEMSDFTKSSQEYRDKQTQGIRDTYKPASTQIVENGVRKGTDLSAFLNPTVYKAADFSTPPASSRQELQGLTQGDSSRILEQRASGPYTAGMGALDSQVYNRSGGAARSAAAIGQQQAALDDARRVNPQAEIQALADRGAAALKRDTQERLKGLLGGIQDSYRGRIDDATRLQTSRLVSQELAARERAKALYEDARGQIDSLQTPLPANLRAGRPDNLRALEEVKSAEDVLSRNFGRMEDPSVPLSQVISPEDAEAMNRIYSFLGLEDRIDREPLADYEVTLDEGAYRSRLDPVVEAAREERRQADALAQQQADAARLQAFMKLRPRI